MKIFSVRDKKGQRYIPVLMLMENFVDAERWFSDLVNDGRSVVSKSENHRSASTKFSINIKTGI